MAHSGVITDRGKNVHTIRGELLLVPRYFSINADAEPRSRLSFNEIVIGAGGV